MPWADEDSAEFSTSSRSRTTDCRRGPAREQSRQPSRSCFGVDVPRTVLDRGYVHCVASSGCLCDISVHCWQPACSRKLVAEYQSVVRRTCQPADHGVDEASQACGCEQQSRSLQQHNEEVGKVAAVENIGDAVLAVTADACRCQAWKGHNITKSQMVRSRKPAEVLQCWTQPRPKIAVPAG